MFVIFLKPLVLLGVRGYSRTFSNLFCEWSEIFDPTDEVFQMSRKCDKCVPIFEGVDVFYPSRMLTLSSNDLLATAALNATTFSMCSLYFVDIAFLFK